MNSNPFFSIIVACCDIEPFAQDMFDSLLGQTYKEFECILVVENSKDNTLNICNQFAAKDPRFKITTQPRSGSPAAPRNTGLKMAKGRYALFLDGDDWLPEDALLVLAQKITDSNYPEVVQGACEEWHDDANGEKFIYKRHFNYRSEDSEKLLTGQNAIILQGILAVNPFPVAWLSIVKIDFIKAYNLYFINGLKYEDEEWTPRLLYYAPRVLPLNHVIYHYRHREGSITTKSIKCDIESKVRVMRHLLHFYSSVKVSKEISLAWERDWLSSLFYAFFAAKSKEKTHSPLFRLAILRHWLKGEARNDLRNFAKCTTRPKRLGIALMLLCTSSKYFRSIILCDLYFRLFYYPLIKLREGRRG